MIVASTLWLFLALAPSDTARLRIADGTTTTGEATPAWLAMVRRRVDDPTYDSVRRIVKRVGADEAAWAALVHARRAAWEGEIAGLAAPFAPTLPPSLATIVLGNRGAADAFTHDPVTIGFDLASLQQEYGAATLPANVERIDRLFRHEYVHLLQKAWLRTHPFPTDHPMARAWFELWTEGMGNLFSLSARWIGTPTAPSAAAVEALARLEPVMVDRLTRLTCAGPREEAALVRDLSSGPFDRKWGALPMALWLRQEVERDPDALRRFIAAGPAGVPAFLQGRLARWGWTPRRGVCP